MVEMTKEYRGFLWIAIASIIWGSNGVIVNWINLPTIAIVFFRTLFASISLFVGIILMRKQNLLRVRNVKGFIFIGVNLGVGVVLLFQSMRLIPIAQTVLLNYTGPVFVTLLAPLFLKERFEKKILFPLGLSVIGILLISLPQVSFDPTHGSFLGTMYALASSLSYTAFIVVSKKTLRDASGFSMAFYSYAVATIVLAPFVAFGNLPSDAVTWVLLLFLGVISAGVGMTIYFFGLSALKAQEAVVLTYLEPVSSIFFGYLLLSQQPTWYMITGGVLIIFAGYFLAYKRK